MNNLSYEGYVGSVELDLERHVLRGKILLINDLVTYEAADVAGLEREFRSAVDDYLQLCKEVGKAPDRAFSGQFQVRTTPALHRELGLLAARKNVSLNAALNEVLEVYFSEPRHFPLDLDDGQRVMVSVASAETTMIESTMVFGSHHV